MNIKSVLGKRKVKDDYLAPEVDEEFIMGEPYGARSPKYNTFDYNEKIAIYKCKEKGGVWCVFIENIGNKPHYSTCRATGMQVDEVFSDYGIPARVLEIVKNKGGKVYVVGVSDDLTTMPERKVSDSRRVRDGLTRSQRYNRNMEKIFAGAEKQNQNQMEWLRQHGASEDEIQNAYKNTGLHGNGLSKLVIQVARENGDERENSEILGEAISDSRVSDAHQYSYGGRDWGGRYDEDFENADEDYETAIELMNGYMRLEEEHGIDWNKKIPVDTWKGLFYDAMEMGDKANITDGDYIFNELENANFHTLNWCLSISGVLGSKWQDYAVAWFSQRFANKKTGKKSDYTYGVNDHRTQALWQIIQEMGLI